MFGHPTSEGGRGNPSVSPFRKTGSEATARNRGFLESEPEASESERQHEVLERARD